MIYFLLTLVLTPIQAEWMPHINDSIYDMMNGLAGRSWILDNLVNLAIDSNLVKASLIGACFLYAWHMGADEAVNFRNRKILIITLIASVFVIASTKTLSKSFFLPRPFIQSQKTFHLEDDRLVESQRLNFRVPLDDENQKKFADLKRGEIIQNDLTSFPSDHAGFFMAISVGILIALRSAGFVALIWTFFIVLGSRVITGQHSPLDIAVGSGIGVGVLLAFQLVFHSIGKRLIDPVVNWTLNHSAFASALIFIYLFEAINTLVDVRLLIHVGKQVVKQTFGG